ncbi:MAG: carboxylating nicotinate-nucleotide diphosphorylase [Alphaproteobacteria bacterium]|jgi:nicotinate-nucleotide pyrophosphorylase (carboxylating)|tara:strand:- start:22737 stop:23594 length:858 start_codon:yes stop_codon:yes gene_type:complete
MIEINPIPQHIIKNCVKNAIAEDLGQAGDLTSNYLIDKNQENEWIITSNQNGVVSGIRCAEYAFNFIDKNVCFKSFVMDGEKVTKDTKIALISGRSLPILTAERTALNFIGHLSGIATETNKFVELTKHTKVKIVSTRKTTPGIRALEKYAIRCGGGFNHRLGLDYAILIKDNHIEAVGGVKEALKLAKQKASHLMSIEIEVDTIEQLEEALKYEAKIILLDNMTIDNLKAAVKIANGGAILEASGNINENNVLQVAETGIDIISIGRLTHSSPSLDISLHCNKK